MKGELDFIISTTDRLTAPLKSMSSGIDKFVSKAQANFRQIGGGALALFGAGMALKSALAPALDMEAALGEVASLDVTDKALDNLRRTAQKFAVDFGASASDFVRSSYDIQSAISGLSGDELAKFTQASAVLSKATKSDTATITNYMGTMYGVFKDTADKMGKTRWIEQVAGQTATAVKLFKTTGSEMSAAFTSLGANAQALKISAAEQFAVLGKLQATMSGSEAGTKYKSFLKGIGNAQNVLGLNFTNKDGTVKSITDILNLIKNKFGDLSKVADTDLIKKAFGSDQAASLIKLLASDVDGLKGNIDKLGNVQGMKTATEMANKMVDPWSKLKSLLEQLRVSVGLRLTPVFAPLVERIVQGGKAFMDWLDEFPNLARWLGYISVSVLGAGAAIAALTVITGIYKMMSLAVTSAASIQGNAIIKLAKAFRLMGLSELFAMWPIALIVVALAALGYIIYQCWDLIKAFFKGFAAGFMQSFDKTGALCRIFKTLGGVFHSVSEFIGKLFEKINWATAALDVAASAGRGFGMVLAAAMDVVSGALDVVLGWLGFLMDCIKAVGKALGNIWDAFDISHPAESLRKIGQIFNDAFHNIFQSLKDRFSGVFNSIVSKLNKLPGVNIKLIETAENSSLAESPVKNITQAAAKTPSALTSGREMANPALAGNVKNGNISTNNHVNNQVTFNIQQEMDRQHIQELINEHTQLAGAM